MAAQLAPYTLLSLLQGKAMNDSTYAKTSIDVIASTNYMKVPGFPDLDYALLGYDSLKGFPLEIGHDPGFTLPIFAIDYSQQRRTADRRYRVPRGMMLIPDVSCITTFSSELVDSMASLSASLALSANVKGSGWGVSFSASVGFKAAMSEISTKKYKLILSTASCNYYFMRLIESKPPPFDPVFVKWVQKLHSSDDEDLYIRFVETYGTHFSTAVTFGASFTYEYKMSSESYEAQQEMALSAAATLSGSSGGFTGEGGFNMSAQMKAAVSEFKESVQIKTITVGAPPPANGDAMTWASTVKNDPVPTKYTLSSIENLFTDKFMGGGIDDQGTQVDYKRIRSTIMAVKNKYCELLKARGLMDDCTTTEGMQVLQATTFAGTLQVETATTFSECTELCSKRTTCVAADFCLKCTDTDAMYQKCRMFAAGEIQKGQGDSNWQAVVLLSKLDHVLAAKDTAVSGIERVHEDIASVTTSAQCLDLCVFDEHCVAFTFCPCPESQKCTLYSAKSMSLTSKSDSVAVFLSPAAREAYTAGIKPKFSLEGSEWKGPVCKSQSDCDPIYATCSEGFCRCDVATGVTSDLQSCGSGPRDCYDVQQKDASSGVKTVNILGHEVSVYCDQTTDGGGWTVIQRRLDGSVDFYQGWNEYEDGFGDKAGEHWLGLGIIYRMTSSVNYKLRVDLEDFSGNTAYAEYSHFSVSGPDDNYRLSVSGYSGTAGDGGHGLSYNNNMGFSTKDRDHDSSSDNCAVGRHGGWWYSKCSYVNLNGRYKSSDATGWDGIVWDAWKSTHSLKRAEMKIRPA